MQAHHLRDTLRTLLKAPGAPTQRTLAARSGVAERTISRILHGSDQTTRFDIADALLTSLDAADALDEILTDQLSPYGDVDDGIERKSTTGDGRGGQDSTTRDS